MLCGVATDDVCVVIEREKGGWKPGTQLCSCPLSNWRRRYRPRYTSTHVGSPLTCDLPNLQQDESSRRHDQQLEQIKEKVSLLAVASTKLSWCSQAAGSRHTSCEEAPCVLPYPRRKWCTLCSVPVSSSNLLILSFQQFTERNVSARVDISLQNDIPQKFSTISTAHVPVSSLLRLSPMSTCKAMNGDAGIRRLWLVSLMTMPLPSSLLTRRM